MGVDHFFLYNNLSDDNHFSILKYYIDRGIVTLRDWPEPWSNGAQTNAYQHCLDQHRNISRWIAFIDLDEFLFAPNAEKLSNVIKEFEHFSGIVVNWQVYGSSGYKNKPAGLVIEKFTMKAKNDWIRNRRVKSIVDPSNALRPVGPHMFEYHSGEVAVTENFEPVRIVKSWRLIRSLKRLLIGFMPRIPLDPYAINQSSVKRVSVNKLRINHYVVKSEEEAMEEIKCHSSLKHIHQMNWLKYHDRNDESDTILYGHVPALKERLLIKEEG